MPINLFISPKVVGSHDYNLDCPPTSSVDIRVCVAKRLVYSTISFIISASRKSEKNLREFHQLMLQLFPEECHPAFKLEVLAAVCKNDFEVSLQMAHLFFSGFYFLKKRAYLTVRSLQSLLQFRCKQEDSLDSRGWIDAGKIPYRRLLPDLSP